MIENCIVLYVCTDLKEICLNQGGAFFVDPFCCLCFVFVILPCPFLAALWSPAGKELTSGLFCM